LLTSTSEKENAFMGSGITASKGSELGGWGDGGPSLSREFKYSCRH